jgi:hypothetical protein
MIKFGQEILHAMPLTWIFSMPIFNFKDAKKSTCSKETHSQLEITPHRQKRKAI